MNRLKLSMFSCVLTTVLTAVLLTAQAAEAASLSSGKWIIVRSPNAEFSSILSGVAALSATNVWAVGFSVHSSGYSQTLTEHWNGSNWMVVKSPNVGSMDNNLKSVVAVSANDIWAVGNSGLNTLIEHWNGSSWMVVKSPNVGLSSSLEGVVAVSANDIWAVGSFGRSSGSPAQTLIEHWNGSSWIIVKSPNVVGSSSSLSGVAAVSANDIWVVGLSEVNFNNGKNLTEHWNGSNWQIVTSPNVGSGVNGLDSVAVVSANDIWAVGGFTKNNGFNTGRTLTEHWNGSSWMVVPSPNAGNGLDNSLSGAARIPGSSDIWAVGSDGYTDGMGAIHTLTEFHNQVA